MKCENEEYFSEIIDSNETKSTGLLGFFVPNRSEIEPELVKTTANGIRRPLPSPIMRLLLN